MAQRLAKELGLGVGISSGANFIGTAVAKQGLQKTANVVTVFSDCNKKYLSTDLAKAEPIKDHFINNEIRLEGFEFVS